MKTRLALLLSLSFAACGGFGTPQPDAGDSPDLKPAVEAKFSSLFADYFGQCASCHAPGAPGRTADIETMLDFSTQAMAHKTITTGKAAGLMGNHAGCNMVPFIQPTAAKSLIVAVVDQPTRMLFDLTGSPNCDATAISDATVKVGAPPSVEFVAALKQWVDAGALND